MLRIEVFVSSMFQVATLDGWGTIARSHVDPDTGIMYATSAIFFMTFLLIVAFTLLPVVVAVLLDNFTVATRNEKDKQLLQAKRNLESQKVIFGLDPLIKTLLAYTNQNEIMLRLESMIDKLDSDRSGALSYAELRDGLKKYTPPIKLSEEEFDAITYNKRLCTEDQEIDFDCWSAIMRQQMVMYCHRQLAVSIPAVIKDDKHLGMMMFAIKLILDRTADPSNELESPVRSATCSPVSKPMLITKSSSFEDLKEISDQMVETMRDQMTRTGSFKDSHSPIQMARTPSITASFKGMHSPVPGMRGLPRSLSGRHMNGETTSVFRAPHMTTSSSKVNPSSQGDGEQMARKSSFSQVRKAKAFDPALQVDDTPGGAGTSGSDANSISLRIGNIVAHSGEVSAPDGMMSSACSSQEGKGDREGGKGRSSEEGASEGEGILEKAVMRGARGMKDRREKREERKSRKSGSPERIGRSTGNASGDGERGGGNRNDDWRDVGAKMDDLRMSMDARFEEMSSRIASIETDSVTRLLLQVERRFPLGTFLSPRSILMPFHPACCSPSVLLRQEHQISVAQH